MCIASNSWHAMVAWLLHVCWLVTDVLVQGSPIASVWFLVSLVTFFPVSLLSFFSVSPVSFYFLRNNSLERKPKALFCQAVDGWQNSFQGSGLLSLGFRSGFAPFRTSAWVTPFKVSGFFQAYLASLGFRGPSTPFSPGGLLSLGLRSGLTPFRVSAWVLGFRFFFQAHLSLLLGSRGPQVSVLSGFCFRSEECRN